jgi:predicted ATPase
MAATIKKLTIEGFKSIRKLDDFELRDLNVLIGPNGAGKSNFVGFFRLVRLMIEQRLQLAVAVEGGADACLFLGPKITSKLGAALYFGEHVYEFALVPTSDNRLVFSDETVRVQGSPLGMDLGLGSGHAEAKLKDHKDERFTKRNISEVPGTVYDSISSWVVYHFEDTSLTAGARRLQELNNNLALDYNAANLAPFLYRIQKTDPTSYAKIRDVVRLAAPFFDDFLLRPMPTSPDQIQLEWRQKDSDYPFGSNQLSDGTLRFICLATALLQPTRPPTVLFDEPELGLHPYALTLLGNLFKQATVTYPGSMATQVIISTQSAPLLNEFAPEDIIVVERTNGESTFRRLDAADLSEWLEDYTLGELWQKNLLGGRPRPDRSLEHVNGGSQRR